MVSPAPNHTPMLSNLPVDKIPKSWQITEAVGTCWGFWILQGVGPWIPNQDCEKLLGNTCHLLGKWLRIRHRCLRVSLTVTVQNALTYLARRNGTTSWQNLLTLAEQDEAPQGSPTCLTLLSSCTASHSPLSHPGMSSLRCLGDQLPC